MSATRRFDLQRAPPEQLPAAELIFDTLEAWTRTTSTWTAHPGSPAADDLAAATRQRGKKRRLWPDDEPVRTMQSIVALTSRAMVEHLGGVAHSLTADLSFAPAVMSRSTLEAAGRIIWVLEGEDLRGRVARCAAIRVRGLITMRRNDGTVAALEMDDPAILARAADNRDRVQEVLRDVDLLGIKVHERAGADGTIERSLAVGLPADVDLVRIALDAATQTSDGERQLEPQLATLLHSALSGYTHSSYDALRASMVDSSARAAGSGKEVRFEVAPANRVTTASYAHFASLAAMARIVSYFGFDPSDLDSVSGGGRRFAAFFPNGSAEASRGHGLVTDS